MTASVSTYEALLTQTVESLRWLAESGHTSIAVPMGWQVPDLKPIPIDDAAPMDSIGCADEPARVDEVHEPKQDTKAPSGFGKILDVVSGTKTTTARRTAAPKEEAKSVVPRRVKTSVELPPGEARIAIEAFLEEEGIVEPELRNQFKRVLSFDRLLADYQQSGLCPVCGGQQEPVLPTLGSDCRAVFIADQPDEREQLMGVPYVGETGTLVARMVKAMGLSRQEVGFAYVNSCSHAEASADDLAEHWQPLLDRYLDLASPEVIVAFGECAARRLTGQTQAFPHLRGQWFEYKGIPVLSTFHPTALIQHPAGKSVVWGDLKNVMRKLGLSVAKN